MEFFSALRDHRTMLLDAYGPVRRAKDWAARAPRYNGEYAFGDGTQSHVLGVFGDSVGCGLGVSDVRLCFAGVLAQRLARRTRVTCRVHAVCGARAKALSKQEPKGDERWAAVSIGSNDALYGEPVSLVVEELTAFLLKLSHAERVVVLGPGNLAAAVITPGPLRPILRRRIEAFDVALRRAVKRFRNARHLSPFLPGLEVDASHFAEDGFHPSEKAHALIAEAAYWRLILD
jgi:lysophospholipase L1-like esterase